ncbi:MAG: hypothetical protein WAS33_15490 [Candidatus Promineifilaceae bacterium]|nr:hypothetical protein [Anaerolineaceae bacterium]
MNPTSQNEAKSHVFYHEDGYVEMKFFGIVPASELKRLLDEMNQIAAAFGPMGVLVDGRNGRLHHDAGTLIALSEVNPTPKLTHMVVLTHTSASRRDVIVQNPTGLVPQVTVRSLEVPVKYISNEAEARQLAAKGGPDLA